MDPGSLEEEEFIQNIFDCLCVFLQHPENQKMFSQAEGTQLMLILWKKKKKLWNYGAMKVIDYALSKNRKNCEEFVKVLGLKRLFSAFMKQKKNLSKAGQNNEEAEGGEHQLNIILSLFRNLEAISAQRLLHKFSEKECEKIDRLIEVRNENEDKLVLFEQQQQAEENQMDEENLYLERLDAGMYVMQLVDIILAYACSGYQMGSDANGGKTEENSKKLEEELGEISKKRLLQIFNQNEQTVDSLVSNLEIYLKNLDPEEVKQDPRSVREMQVIIHFINTLK